MLLSGLCALHGGDDVVVLISKKMRGWELGLVFWDKMNSGVSRNSPRKGFRQNPKSKDLKH